MGAVNRKALTMTLPSPGADLAFGIETPGCGTVVAMFRHNCVPNVALVRPGVDKVGVGETEGMAAEDVWEGEEVSHIELNASAGEHCLLNQIWCPGHPSCIVSLRIQVIKRTRPERKTQ
jgi:hypothetical protein